MAHAQALPTETQVVVFGVRERRGAGDRHKAPRGARSWDEGRAGS